VAARRRGDAADLSTSASHRPAVPAGHHRAGDPPRLPAAIASFLGVRHRKMGGRRQRRRGRRRWRRARAGGGSHSGSRALAARRSTAPRAAASHGACVHHLHRSVHEWSVVRLPARSPDRAHTSSTLNL